MASEKQIAANRRNSKKSTGPRTIEGKAKVTMNAIKHGLLSKKVLLSDEDAAEFEEFSNEIFAAMQPQGGLENVLLDKVVVSIWRMRRAIEVESLLYQNTELEFLGKATRATRFGTCTDLLQDLSRYEGSLERSLYKALHEFQRIQGMRLGSLTALPLAVDVSFDNVDGSEYKTG